MAEKFEILSPRNHVRQRMSIYLGSPEKFSTERFVVGKWKPVTYVPALVKMVSEIIDNSVDEAIRTKFAHANKISVVIENDYVTVTDNGRGIPQDKIIDTNGETILRPVAAWVRTNAGSNFDDTSRDTQGMNGVGSACTNFVSEVFHGETWQNGKKVIVSCLNGELQESKVVKQTGNGTTVKFKPDFSLFEANSLSDDGVMELIEDRLLNLQVSFPKIDFTLNGNKIPGKNFKDYASQYSEDTIVEDNTNLSFVIFPSDDGFRSNSFINGLNTHEGGTHIDFLIGSLVDELGVLIKKKYKIEVAKSTIKNGLSVVMFVRGFINPRFGGQTKEKFTSPWGQFKTHYEETVKKDFKFFAKKIMENPVIIDPIVAAQLAKKLADEKREEAHAKKGLKKIKVAKHVAATSPDATLCLVEGDSALGFALKVRDPKKVGMYPLRGVVMNTWGMRPVDVLKNKELSELTAILGLDVTDPDSVDNMTYGSISTLTDADHDGEKIATLLCAFFYKFWPRLFDEGKFRIIRSPIMITTPSGKKQSDVWSFGYKEAENNKQKHASGTHRYIKGLASLTEDEYSRIINQPVFSVISIDDPKYFEIMFGNDSAPRKTFMMS